MGLIKNELTVLQDFRKQLDIEEQILIKKGLTSDDPNDIMASNSVFNERLRGETKTDQKTYIFDPFQWDTGQGYKTKPTGLTYGLLRNMAKTPIVYAVIKTRREQVSAFLQPQVNKYSPGFKISKKKKFYLEEEQVTTTADYKKIEFLTEFLINGGDTGKKWKGDSFETIIDKILVDSLEIDQAAFEIIRNKNGNGRPVEFLAADGATFRYAKSINEAEATNEIRKNGYLPAYVQIYQGEIVSYFYPWELCLGIRNKRTDIKKNGYGESELEILIRTITAMLNADAYNAKFFTNGAAPKGMLKVAGNVNQARLQEFKQQWMAQVAGVLNAWKTPVIEGDTVEWIDLQKNNRDMEFSHYQEWLLKTTCACYTIDPSEINFPMQGSTGAQSMFQGDPKSRLDYSREKGLKPLLRRIERWVNKYIISELDPNYVFEFAGINTEDKDKELEANVKRATNYVTVDEVRAKDNLPPLPDGAGKLPANQFFLSQKQMAMMGDPASNGAMGDEYDDYEDPYQDEDNPIQKSYNEWLERETNKEL